MQLFILLHYYTWSALTDHEHYTKVLTEGNIGPIGLYSFKLNTMYLDPLLYFTC